MLARLVFPFLLLFTCHAHAGRSCSDAPPQPEAVRKGLDLALKTRNTLDASAAQTALVARVGKDLSRYGLRYSHLAIAWRDHPAGRWFVVHELNACGTAGSDLYDEGLGNFFLDDLHAHEALILIPPPELQQRLATLLQAGSVLKLHAPQYNMVAHPFSTRYQNSNQWVLETLAAALAPAGSVDSRASAQAWLKDAGFAPTTLAISTLERLGARVSRANIAFDDHPPERRFAGRIDTVSVESVAGFLLRRAGGTQSLTVGVE